ncbi:pasang lhamu [Carabus blaptoides fortunei]
MSAVWKVYQRSLGKYPILTQAIQTGLLMGTGDLISQTIIEKKTFSNINWVRTAQFTSVGLFIGGPGLRTWYGILNKYVGSQGTTVVLKKVALDQLLFAPVFIGVLLGTIGAMQGQSIEDNINNLKRDYPDVLPGSPSVVKRLIVWTH